MGFFDAWDGASVISRKSSHSHKHKKRSRSRSRSRDKHHGHSHGHSHSHHRKHSGSGGGGGVGGLFGLDNDSHYHKHNASKGSFFGLGNNHSTRSFFGVGRSSSSYYKRSSRPNLVSRLYKKLKRLLRDLMYYAKKHPVKVFVLVVMPLVTGGALTALLARFGLRLPPGLERMLGLAARTAGGGGGLGLVGEAVKMAGGLGGGGGSVSIERGRDGSGYQWEKRSEYSRGGEGGGGFFGGIGRMFS